MLMSSDILNVLKIISRALRTEGDMICLCEQTPCTVTPIPFGSASFNPDQSVLIFQVMEFLLSESE